MNACSILKRADYDDYVFGLHFGEPEDWLTVCIEQAYGEISRTMRGLSRIPARTELHTNAMTLLGDEIGQLEANTAINIKVFDAWHRQVCEALLQLYAKSGYPKMTMGQAQRWLNTVFRLIFAMGPQRIPGYEQVYPFCHLPIDTDVIEKLAPRGLPSLTTSWARLQEYDRYMVCQYWVRETLVFSALDIDLLLQLGKIPELDLR